jgi:hypothetical protein
MPLVLQLNHQAGNERRALWNLVRKILSPTPCALSLVRFGPPILGSWHKKQPANTQSTSTSTQSTDECSKPRGAGWWQRLLGPSKKLAPSLHPRNNQSRHNIAPIITNLAPKPCSQSLQVIGCRFIQWLD